MQNVNNICKLLTNKKFNTIIDLLFITPLLYFISSDWIFYEYIITFLMTFIILKETIIIIDIINNNNEYKVEKILFRLFNNLLIFPILIIQTQYKIFSKINIFRFVFILLMYKIRVVLDVGFKKINIFCIYFGK